MYRYSPAILVADSLISPSLATMLARFAIIKCGRRYTLLNATAPAGFAFMRTSPITPLPRSTYRRVWALPAGAGRGPGKYVDFSKLTFQVPMIGLIFGIGACA